MSRDVLYSVGGPAYSNPDWRIRPLDLGQKARRFVRGCDPCNTTPSNSIRILTRRMRWLHAPRSLLSNRGLQVIREWQEISGLDA